MKSDIRRILEAADKQSAKDMEKHPDLQDNPTPSKVNFKDWLEAMMIKAKSSNAA